MDYSENVDAIVMPSRSMMLTGIPPELNNSDTLGTYFSKYGALLWVNEKYNDSDSAVITFFSVAEAIAAFMCNEAILEHDSIQKSWYEYTKNCDLCSYKYSSEDSIKKHMAQRHPSKEIESEFRCEDDGAKGPAYGAIHSSKDANQPLIAKNLDLITTSDLMRNQNERVENEITSLKRKNSDLNDALNKSVKQREIELSEIGILNDKLDLLQAEKSNVEDEIKEKRKQLEEKDSKLREITTKFTKLEKENKRMTHEFLTLKQKYEDLNNSFNRALEQRDMTRSEADTLRIDLATLKADKNGVDGLLKEKYKQLEGKELEFMRFLSGHELLLKEKERLENELNAMKDVGKENKLMKLEISSMNSKIKDLNEALRQANARHESATNSTTPNCNMQAMLAENQKLVQNFKVECKRLEEMEQDFKRISVKYDLLLRQKEHLGRKLTDDAHKSSIDMNNIQKDRDQTHSKIHELSEQLKSTQAEKGKIESRLNDKCKLIEEKELKIKHITTKYEWLLKETERMDNELLSLKRKNDELVESLNNDTEHQNLSQMLTLREKLETLKAEKQQLSDNLKEKCQQLDLNQMELGQLSLKLELQLKENKRLETELKDTKELLVGKDFVNTESSSFMRKNNISSNTLHSIDKEKGSHSFSGLQGLQAENGRVVEALKDNLIHKDEHELGLRRYSTRNALLMSEMESANAEKDWSKEKERMSSEIMALTIRNKELMKSLNSAIMQRENERIDFGNLNGKLQSLQDEMDKVLNSLEENSKQLEEKEREVNRLSESNKLLNSEMNELKAQKEQLLKTAEENTRLKMEIERYQRDNCKLISELDAIKLQLRDKENKISSILMDSDMLRKEIDKLESESKEKSRELLNNAGVLLNLTKENEKLAEELQLKNQLMQNIQSSIDLFTPK